MVAQRTQQIPIGLVEGRFVFQEPEQHHQSTDLIAVDQRDHRGHRNPRYRHGRGVLGRQDLSSSDRLLHDPTERREAAKGVRVDPHSVDVRAHRAL
jgi:hypothetical protein